MKSQMTKFTLKDFQKMFPDDDTCLDYIRHKKFPERIDCPACGKNSLFHHDRGRKSYSCDHCGFQISPTAGTIYHKSSTPLTVWFYVAYLMAQTRGGISAKQIERETGVTYKTAWRMCKEIRHALNEDYSPFDGDVEMDESYFGGRKHGKRGRGAAGKTPVFGIAQRGGMVEARVVPNVRRISILPIVDANVARTAHIYTDEMHTYKALPSMGYTHDTIPHAEKIYVMGNVHTNTIEGFWSNVKNGIRGVYHAVSSKYLQSYLNEYSFRYNHRKDVTPMFWSFLHRSVFYRAS
ncbi:MAG: IS1595 family transposase [Anaerolineales bacterium]